MNIFGRVFGGLLVLISLGWLASIAGIRPGGLASNQIDGNSQPKTTDLKASPQKGAADTKPGTQTGVSKFTPGQPIAGQQASGQPAAGKTEVESNPRGVNTGNKAVGQNAANKPEGETAPEAVPPQKSAPVNAGW